MLRKTRLTVALCAINNISFQKLLTCFVQLLKVAIKFKKIKVVSDLYCFAQPHQKLRIHSCGIHIGNP